MKITTLLFDLDGTLLPLDQDEFIIEYFRLIAEYLIKRKPNAEKYINTVKKAVFGMMKNDGSCTNEALFAKLYKKSLAPKKIPNTFSKTFIKTISKSSEKFADMLPRQRK